VPSYREDAVPSSPTDSGKTVSSAQTAPEDATPPDTDLGTHAPSSAGEQSGLNTPGGSSGSPGNTSTPTAGPAGATEGPGGEPPASDATNPTDAAMGEGGTPLADRGQEPLNPQDPS
jgi:hypothetical protein